MDQVFGNAGSVTQQPNLSTISPAQSQLQQILASLAGGAVPSLLGRAQGGAPALPAPTQFAAPLTGEQTSLIGDITGQATTGNTPAVLGNAQQALTQILSGQPLDYSQYFKDVIAAPLENTFNTQTLPGIKAAFARSAGGTTSSGDNTGYSAAVGQATDSLNRSLASAQSSLGATAITNAQQERAQGVSQAPGLASSFLTTLGQALSAASLPQQTEQTQLTGQANWANTALSFLSSLFGGSGALANQGTVQQGNTVAMQPFSGILPSLIGTGGLLGSAAIMSDPRVKDIKGKSKALDVIKKLTVKDAKYKWEGEDKFRPMLMADNVEKVYPQAAVRISNLGHVKPHELIALLVKGVQELEKKAA